MRVIERPNHTGRGAEKPRDPNDVPLRELVQKFRDRADKEHELKRALEKLKKMQE